MLKWKDDVTNNKKYNNILLKYMNKMKNKLLFQSIKNWNRNILKRNRLRRRIYGISYRWKLSNLAIGWKIWYRYYIHSMYSSKDVSGY